MDKKVILILLGPTAVGKTEISLEIAKEFNCEIVSVDSRQIYKLMDIGTAKPSPEIRKEIPHHLIDIVFPDEVFTAGDFCFEAEKIIEDISNRGRIPFLVGGTALYYWLFLRNPMANLPRADKQLREELLKTDKARLYEELLNIDPESARRIHPNDLYRIVRAIEVFRLTGKPISFWYSKQQSKSEKYYDILWIGLIRDRVELYDRINRRVNEMISKGLIDEVKALLDMGYSPELPAMKGHGYRELCEYFLGKISLDKAVEAIKRDTRHYAKRQITWFKKWIDIEWFHPDKVREIKDRIERWLNEKLK